MKKHGLAPQILYLCSAIFFICAILNIDQEKKFDNPVGYTVSDNVLYVLEKEKNTVLAFDLVRSRDKLVLYKSVSVEPDEGGYYFMARKLYKGPAGIVVKSYIYDKNSREFLGYRFREYLSIDLPPKDILTVLLKNPKDYPEINYATDKNKFHYLVNNCEGHRNIWKIPPSGAATVNGADIPVSLTELGDKNNEFSSYEAICVGPDGEIYLSSGELGKIVKYSPEGIKIGEIGEVGFGEGQLLAPDSVFFASLDPEKGEELLTVASCGTRSWIQYDGNGKSVRTVNLLKAKYPFADILVGDVYSSNSKQRLYSFDLVNKNFIRLNNLLKNEKINSPASPFASVSKWMSDTGRTNSGTFYKTKFGWKFIFSGIACLAFCIIAFFYKRLKVLAAVVRLPFFLKLLLLFIPMLVVSSNVVASWINDIMKRNIEEEYVRRSANLAHAVINNVSVADLEKIRKPEDRVLPEYERIYQTVSSILDTDHVEQTPKWIIHKILGGRYYYGINIWKGAIYEPFIIPEGREMFYNVLKDKVPAWGRFSDDQGEWFSYLYPVCDSKHDVIFVLELYRPSESIDRAEQAVTSKVNKVVVFTVFVAAFIALCFSYLFTRPLKALISGTEMISAGNFHHHIEVNSRDELADLGKAFNRMVSDLRKYTEDLKKNTAENERISSELHLARDIQRGMLPSVFPPFPGAENIEICADMIPAKTIGGDYYDFFPVDDDNFGVVIADASGKGIPAALFVMVIRTLIRNIAIMNPSPADVVAKLNLLLSIDNVSSSFASLFYFVFNRKTGRVRYCNAGHLPPIKFSGGKAQLIDEKPDMRTGMIVGVLPDAEFSENEFYLKKGETLVLYTDGITETVNDKNILFGEEKLISIIEDYSILTNKEISKFVVRNVFEYQTGLDQFDDMTLLFFKHI